MGRVRTKPQARVDVVDSTRVPVQQKFVRGLEQMNASLVERDDENFLALTGMLAQEHVLFVGEPGVAKSLVADIAKEFVVGASRRVVHCCKDTTRAMAFGPIDVAAIKDGHQKRVLTGGAADAHILVLEEVFKAGPAVLDMFLLVMNERRYEEGVFSAKVPLKLLIGTSNEWSPDGCEAALAAFFDRFLFRKHVQPVTNAGLRVLLRKAVANDPCRPDFDDYVTLDEIERAHTEAMQLPVTDGAKLALWKIIEGLAADGIKPGNRRVMKAVKAARAAAYLACAAEVRPEHLDVLRHVLWVDPQEQPLRCAKIVSRIANPTGAIVQEKVGQIAEIVDGIKGKLEAIEAVSKLEQIEKDLQALPAVPARETALRLLREGFKTAHYRAIGAKQDGE